jgi:3-oxoacyl-[acyl-carrier protein] reductase
MDIFKAENKVIIITGAGSGIGKKTAILFAKEGAKVIVADVNEKGGNETVAEIKKNGEGFFAKLDVTNREQSKQMVKTTLGKYGRIDVLINNAGIVQDAPQFGFLSHGSKHLNFI